MQLKCVGIIDTFKTAFQKGKEYTATEMKAGFCDVIGDRKRKDGGDWTGVHSVGHVVILGVAKFEILPSQEQ